MCAPESIDRPIASTSSSIGRGGDASAGSGTARVDHLVAGIAQDAGDHLDAAVVAVEADLGDQDPFGHWWPSDRRHLDVAAEHGLERGHDLAERGVGRRRRR